jgi:hypothetical protein
MALQAPLVSGSDWPGLSQILLWGAHTGFKCLGEKRKVLPL